MKTKIEKLPHSRVKMTITAEPFDLKPALIHALEHVTSRVTIKGFRPGKAPIGLRLACVGQEAVLRELIDHALPDFVASAAKKEKLTLIEMPRYTVEKLPSITDAGQLAAESRLVFTAEMDVAPSVAVGDYTKLKVKAIKPSEVTAKALDDMIADLARQGAPWAAMARPSQTGDRMTIAFVGKRNGLPDPRLKSDDYPIILGTNVMIPGFEAELLGKKAGDKTTFALSFPADYHTQDLAGQTATFEVEVKFVEDKIVPTLDDSFAKTFGHDSMKKLQAAVADERQRISEQQAKETTQKSVLDAFEKLVKVDLPRSLVERELDRHVAELKTRIESQGFSFERYVEHLKKTPEQLRGELRPVAAKAVTIGLGLGEVAKREELKGPDPGRAAIDRLVKLATRA